MPAEAVERDGMRDYPAPPGLRIGQGLILHLDCFRLADRIDHGPEGCRIYAARRGGGGIVGGQSGDPAVVLIKDAVGDRPQLGEIPTGIELVEHRLEAWLAHIGPQAAVVVHVVRGEADVAAHVG